MPMLLPAGKYKKTIKNIRFEGGLAITEFTDDTSVPSDAGITARSYESAFGSLQGAIGNEIEFEVSDYGTMLGFNPIERDKKKLEEVS